MVALPLRGALAFRAEPRKPMGNLMARARGSEAPAAGASDGGAWRGAPRGVPCRARSRCGRTPWLCSSRY